jgi:hypothetical protein
MILAIMPMVALGNVSVVALVLWFVAIVKSFVVQLIKVVVLVIVLVKFTTVYCKNTAFVFVVASMVALVMVGTSQLTALWFW